MASEKQGMETKEMIGLFTEFFENNYTDKIVKARSFLEIDFNALSKWNLDLANELLENPEDIFKAAEIALGQIDIAVERGLSAWFINLPKTQQRNVWEVRRDDIGKMIALKGIINKASSIVHVCKSAKFECPTCLPKGTNILTPHGLKPIEEIDEVVCVDYKFKPTIQKARVLNMGKQELHFINDDIKCSGEHQWFVYRNGTTQVIQTKHLKIGDILYKINYGKLHNMLQGTSKKIYSPLREDNKIYKKNLLSGMQGKILQLISRGRGKAQIRQRTDNQNVSGRKIVFDGNRKETGCVSQDNKKKVNQTEHPITVNQRTMQDKFRKEGIQAWQEMWRKRLQAYDQEFSSEMLQVWQDKREIRKKIISSSYRWKPHRQQNREFDDTMSILPYKIISLRETKEEKEMYELQVLDYNNFILENGIVSHNCGNIINVPQFENTFKEPSKCSCGRKGKMSLLSKEITDIIKLGLIDDLMEKENVDRSIAREKLSILSGDHLTSHSIDKMIKPGRKVILNGYFKYVQKPNSTEFNSIFCVNSIEFVEVGWDTVQINKKEEKEIIKLAKEPNIIERLSESIADVEGYKEAKIACLLLLAGAPMMYDENGHLVSRGTIHVLLIGDPGCQPAGSKVMIADGSWKNIEDIKVGDEVLSPKKDGSYEYNKVKSTAKWYSSENYDVVQLNRQKRKLYSCSYNHIIPFHHKVMPRRKDKRPKELRYWDYKEIEAQAYSKMRMDGKQRKNVGFTSFLIPKFKGRKNCSIEPYSLGMFLGDGSFTVNKYLNKNNREYSSRQLSITTTDFEVIQEISKYYPIRNITTKEDNKAKAYYFSLNGEFAKQLNYYRLEGKKSKDKFIPEDALYSDSPYRLKLLAGLVDSDGTLNKECYSITSVSNQLIKGIEHLIYTLGGRCSIKEMYVKYKGNKHKYYHLSFYLGSLRLPLLCKRKRKTNSEIYVSSDRVAIDVIPSKPGYVYGFELESENKWYITDNYMITHNTAKTFLIKRAGPISPVFYFQSAATSSGKGLVASVAQDKEIAAWAIYPGVVAMASKGVIGLDEIDKTHKDDYGDHNNAMNDMIVPIARANVKAKLETETSYLATANPLNRIFTSYEPYHNQIDMPKDFQDRFDIILPMMPPDKPEEREKIMDIMLERHIEEKEQKNWNPEFSHEFIRKYIAYCRRINPNPKMSRKLFKTIKKRLSELMRPRDEEQVKVSYRHLESIMRFAYASARLRLRDITEEDIDLAFSLKYSSFRDLGIIDTSGIYNWSIEEGVVEDKISDDKIIHDVLKEFLPDIKVLAEMQEIINACVKKGVDEEKVEEYIEKKKRMGDMMEPRRGFLQRL